MGDGKETLITEALFIPHVIPSFIGASLIWRPKEINHTKLTSHAKRKAHYHKRSVVDKRCTLTQKNSSQVHSSSVKRI